MNKTILKVPAGIEYISDWKGYRIEDYPHILDKQIPGCGYTEFCIRNDQNVILCSPRRILLKNKTNQHLGEVFLVESSLEDLGVDIDISKTSKSNGGIGSIVNIYNYLEMHKKELQEAKEFVENRKKLNEELKKEFDNLRENLSKYFQKRRAENKPLKILVTYDSFKKVKSILKDMNILEEFNIVVDEWQSIFTDSFFKPDTENSFLDQLKGMQKVCYVSATPMVESYLEQIDEFKDLPYISLDWVSESPARLIRPTIDVHSLYSITNTASNIIKIYKSGKGAKELRRNPKTGEQEFVQSKEAVFYVNSVENILKIIKHDKLTPSEVNILCADTESNRKKIQKKLGKKFSIGDVPLRDQPRKMFTFCTRTVYLGADFYSDNARSFIFSDANVNTLIVDITLDLPQILGRQRLLENPWRSKATLYVKPLFKKNEVPKKTFDKYLKEKKEQTGSFLTVFGNIQNLEDKRNFVSLVKKFCADSKYKHSYLSVEKLASSNDYRSIDYTLKFNKLVFLSEQRAFEIQQVDYNSRFYIKNVINGASTSNILLSEADETSNKILEHIKSLSTFPNKMKYLCERLSGEAPEIVRRVLDQMPKFYRTYYLGIGPDRCRACGYNYDRIADEFNNKILNKKDEVKDSILKAFEIGKTYEGPEIKNILSQIYKDHDYRRKVPKINDLEDLFTVKRSSFIENGVRINKYRILEK